MIAKVEMTINILISKGLYHKAFIKNFYQKYLLAKYLMNASNTYPKKMVENLMHDDLVQFLRLPYADLRLPHGNLKFSMKLH